MADQHVAWHSEHYRNEKRVAETFKRLWVDALTAHPEGLTVPGVVRFVMSDPTRLIGLGAWCLSYGKEQALRSDVLQATKAQKYYAKVWPQCSTDRDRIAAVLTERLAYYAHIMRMKSAGQLVSKGTEPLRQDDNFSRFYIILSERPQGGFQHPVRYRLGPNQVLVQVVKDGRIKHVPYVPNSIDWDLRRNQLEAKVIDLVNARRPTIAEMKETLLEAVRVLNEDETPGILDHIKWHNPS